MVEVNASTEASQKRDRAEESNGQEAASAPDSKKNKISEVSKPSENLTAEITRTEDMQVSGNPEVFSCF